MDLSIDNQFVRIGNGRRVSSELVGDRLHDLEADSHRRRTMRTRKCRRTTSYDPDLSE